MRTGFALSAGGFAFTGFLLAVGSQPGLWPFPGVDPLIFDRAGDAIRAGASPYGSPGTLTFYFAPPWAVAFALVSWLPPALLQFGLGAIALLSLRYMFGSWLRVGWVCWCPFVAYELSLGQLNLVVAAAIVAAIRGDTPLAVAGALAKLGPVLALDPREWRRIAVVSALAVGLTLPWLGLWAEWARLLVASAGQPMLGLQLPIPWTVRLAAAGGLLLVRRPWSRAAAAALAIPSFHPVSLLLLLAPLAVVLRQPAQPNTLTPAAPVPPGLQSPSPTIASSTY